MNVALVLVDSLRKDHVGAYGSDCIQTPGLDALAGESFRFMRAYPESIPSIPARRGIHTGLRSTSDLYPELTEIAFMMRHPEGALAGETGDHFASTHDVAPTALGFLGVEPPEPHLFGLEDDPKMDRNFADANPDVVKRMWNDYVLGDAGGPPPRY